MRISEEESGESLTERVSYSAEDSVVSIPGESRVILYGKARVEYEGMNMEAARLDINYSTSLVKAYGTLDSTGQKTGLPLFKEGDERMEADTIKYNLRTKKGKIYNAMTHQGELLVVGSEIKKDSNDITYFKRMRCLPCQEPDARTAFIATRAKVIPNDKIVTGPMYLEIGGVPTPLGLPFGYFPNTKRQHNGVILPKFQNSPGQGYALRDGGFYWGISDMTDMIFGADIYANGSWKLGATNNYLVLYKASGAASISYTEFNIGDKDIPKLFQKQKAYSVEWRHTQDNRSNPSVRFSANVNVKNNQTFNRLNSVNSGQFLQNTFQSNINYTKTWKLASLSANALHSQNSITKRMDVTLPALTFNVNRFFPFKRRDAVKPNVFDKIGVDDIIEFRNSLSGTDSSILKSFSADSLQNGVRQTLRASTNFNILNYITATPRVSMTSVMYTKSFRRDYVWVNDTARVKGRVVKEFTAGYDAIFSTDFNTQVFFDYFFSGRKLKQVRHVLIPTLTYSYRPDYGTPKYAYWRTVQRDDLGNTLRYSAFERGIFGGPAQGETNALTLNLNNMVDAKLRQKSDTGITFKKAAIIQMLSLTGSYNFAADSFQMSTISASGRTQLFKHIDVNANASLDPYRFDQNKDRLVQQMMFGYDGRLARLTNISISVGTAIGSNMLEAFRKLREPPDQTNGAERGGGSKAAVDGAIPWNLRTTYIVAMTNPKDNKLQPTQTMNFSGDVMPTKYWRIGISSGFDFTTQRLSYTSVNIYRDLKCWEARIDWVPFGIRKSYALAINLKTSMLSEFKIPRQRQWYDNLE